jgi:hypothetical protein
MVNFVCERELNGISDVICAICSIEQLKPEFNSRAFLEEFLVEKWYQHTFYSCHFVHSWHTS